MTASCPRWMRSVAKDELRGRKMGFGLLFIGYFMASLMSLNYFGAAFELIGYIIILISALKLKHYNKDFRYLCFGACMMIAISSVLALADLSSWLYKEMFIASPFISDKFELVFSYISMGAVFVFSGTMLYPIRSIAKETGVEKISIGASRNFIFIVVYYILTLIAYLPFPFTADYIKYFGVPVLLFNFICIALNHIVIFSCYAKICDANDTEMLRKPSRFAFVNRFREESERRRAEAAEEAEKRRRERAERKRNGK